MALVFIKKSGEKTRINIPWQDDFLRWVKLSAWQFSEIHADGNELEYLKRCFVNLPYCHAYTVWSGEWALFVANNFPHYFSKEKSFEQLWKSFSKAEGDDPDEI